MLVTACQTDDSNEGVEQINPDDLDGDGVTNQQEAVDNTDPNNPCDFLMNSQYYPSVSNTWKNHDCDGDGVSNWKELDPDGNDTVEDNGTSPLQDCSFIFEDQTLEPSSNWLNSDCDFDGVTNAQEIIDGTHLLNQCDFVYANQDSEPALSWLLYVDCDNDGINNGREIEDNTDLLDPTDFNGAGTKLKEVFTGTYGTYHRKFSFTNEGERFNETTFPSNGLVYHKHYYDNEGYLTQIFIADDQDINIYYTYTNNKISNVLKTQTYQDDYSYSVVYEENIIYTYDGTQPPGLYTKKLILNNEGVLVSMERYTRVNDNTAHYTLQVFEYDSNFENLLSTSSERILGYNIDTEQTYSLDPNNYIISETTFTYNQEGVLNPFDDSYQNIYTNMILDYGDSIYTDLSNFFFFGKKLRTSFSTTSEFGSITESSARNYEATYIQENGLPTRITNENPYNPGITSMDLYYE